VSSRAGRDNKTSTPVGGGLEILLPGDEIVLRRKKAFISLYSAPTKPETILNRCLLSAHSFIFSNIKNFLLTINL
jgi:hypothetical protein